ncbi:hypothetical protein Dda_2421 [Drechslerella dactyloides]|uniref:BZIP domain-containing protein n=1 Tax=Drechslerella dactyloides TaxID=74499 RepID=A0AAD6J3I2_DREDA|nr:hypothetical protein Dda_2421 [Drechslerella dactyloides]
MAAPNKVTKRKSPVPVPDVAGASDERLEHIEDPAERKRVLNVLAQRRYRRRKREHQLELQLQVERQKQLQRDHSLSQTKESRLSDGYSGSSDRSDNARELEYLRRRVAQLEAVLYAKPLETQSTAAVPLGSSDPFDAFGNTAAVEHALSTSSDSEAGTFGSEGILENWMLAQASSSQGVTAPIHRYPEQDEAPEFGVVVSKPSAKRLEDCHGRRANTDPDYAAVPTVSIAGASGYSPCGVGTLTEKFKGC